MYIVRKYIIYLCRFQKHASENKFYFYLCCTFLVILFRGRRGRDRMVVGFTTTYAIRARCTTLCDKVCQLFATGQWFSPGPPVSSTNKTDHHNITGILLKVALSIIEPQKFVFILQCKTKMTVVVLIVFKGVLYQVSTCTVVISYKDSHSSNSFQGGSLSGQYLYSCHFLSFALHESGTRKALFEVLSQFIWPLFSTMKPVSTEPHWDQLLCSEQTSVQFIHVKFTKISYILTFFLTFLVLTGFWFIQGLDMFHCTLYNDILLVDERLRF